MAAPASAVAAPEHATYRTQLLPPGTPGAVASAARDANAGGHSARRTRIDFSPTKRFSLAALRWADGSLAVHGRLRAQRVDGTWSQWSDLESQQSGDDGVTEGANAEAAASARRRTAVLGKEGSTEPVWTAPARRLQVDVVGARPPGLRAAFVDVTGRVPSAAPRAVAARASRAGRASDEFAGIRPRSDWDPNNECAPRAPAQLGSVQAITVHHTDGANDYSPDQVPAILLGICKYHRNSNGWNDVGYNVLVDKFGGAWEGRAGGLTNAVIGAHAQGFNSVAAGISMLGDYMAVAPPPALVATVARVAAWKLAVAGVPRSGTVDLTSAGGSLSRFGAGKVVTLPRLFAHRDVGQTDCPGNVGYTILDSLRSSIAAANPTLPVNLPATPAPAPLPVKITIRTQRRLDAGASAIVTGTATQGTAPLKAASVALQVSDAGGANWQTISTARTASSGKYRFARKFSRSWSLRVVRTDGDGGTSASVAMAIVPRLKLTVPKRMRSSHKVTLRGSIAPGRGPVTLLIERRSSSGRYVAGVPKPARLTGRTITVSITPHSVALYRFRLRYAGSTLAAPARSPLVYARVIPASTGGGASLAD